MLAMRGAVPARAQLSYAEFATMRLRLIKIAARVVEGAARIRVYRYNRSRCVGFRNDPTFVFRPPPAPAPNPNADIDTTAALRSVNYMVNHICEPISSNQFASCSSPRVGQGGGGAPLTV